MEDIYINMIKDIVNSALNISFAYAKRLNNIVAAQHIQNAQDELFKAFNTIEDERAKRDNIQ